MEIIDFLDWILSEQTVTNQHLQASLVYLDGIVATLGQIEGILWFFVFVIVLWFAYRFLCVFL